MQTPAATERCAAECNLAKLQHPMVDRFWFLPTLRVSILQVTVDDFCAVLANTLPFSTIEEM